MSKQVNFFADADDLILLHARIWSQFAGLTVIGSNRGKPEELQPIPAHLEGALTSGPLLLLVPQWGRSRVSSVKVDSELQPDVWCIHVRENPVIEYSPPFFAPDTQTAKIGRLYWAFEGELCDEHHRQVERLLRWVRSRSTPFHADRRFRLFQGARKRARLLDFDLRMVRANPQYEGNS